jgi:hypothetical protein
MPVEAQIAALNTCGIVAPQKPGAVVGVGLTEAGDYMRLALHDTITNAAHQRFQPVASSKDIGPTETLAAEQAFNKLEIVGHLPESRSFSKPLKQCADFFPL